MRIGPDLRFAYTFDGGVHDEIPAPTAPDDPLHFVDLKPYRERLAAARKASGERDAVSIAAGEIHRVPAVVMVQDFAFLGGSLSMGAGEAFICAGVESMTRVPQGGFNPSPNLRFRRPDRPEAEFDIEAYIPMGETAENVSIHYGVPRPDQELLAYESQMKAAAAQAAGRLVDEIVPVTTPDGIVDRDGCLRPQTTLEGLAALKPAFHGDGTVTAGTASPLTDGAAAVLVTSEEFAAQHGLTPLARIRSTAIAGCEPEFMGMGPVPATRKALARAGLTIDDIDIIEINEAFGSQAVACLRELGIDRARVNLDGGAIALGHPLGATGARITGKAAQLLKREGKRYALATQCIGGGQGIATVLESI